MSRVEDLDRLKKLLALAGSANEHEARNAAARTEPLLKDSGIRLKVKAGGTVHSVTTVKLAHEAVLGRLEVVRVDGLRVVFRSGTAHIFVDLKDIEPELR